MVEQLSSQGWSPVIEWSVVLVVSSQLLLHAYVFNKLSMYHKELGSHLVMVSCWCWTSSRPHRRRPHCHFYPRLDRLSVASDQPLLCAAVNVYS